MTDLKTKGMDELDRIARQDVLGIEKMRVKRQGDPGGGRSLVPIYGFIIAIPLLFLISFVFYSLAAVDGKVFGTPEDEID